MRPTSYHPAITQAVKIKRTKEQQQPSIGSSGRVPAFLSMGYSGLPSA